MARLLDKKRGTKFPFRYRSSASTNIRDTFNRVKPGWAKPALPKAADCAMVHRLPIQRRKP